MNYTKIYNNIIQKRILFPYVGYSEKHHIIPRSLGGSDDKTNLVNLSAKEHFVCHLLLTKIHSTGPNHFKMVRAFMMMLVSSINHKRYYNSRSYATLREEYSHIVSEAQTGNGNSQYGKIWISDPLSGKSLKIKKTDNVPNGYYPGRNLKWKSCPMCNNIHYQLSKFCVECKEEMKNKPPAIKRISKPRIIKPKISKDCPVCKLNFISDGSRTYCSKKCATTLGNNSVARKVIDDAGTTFNTLTEAAKFYKISVEAIRYRIKIGRYQYGR